jgi:ribosomal protein S18 acetylase RimI-like enzyme
MSSGDIVIRPITREEAPVWRALRLEAMRAYPAAFSASPDDWEKLPLGEVAARIPLPGGDDVLYGVYLYGELSGCAGFAREKGAKERHKGLLWGVYLRATLQGRGLGERLTRMVIDWARPRVDLLLCSVGSDNLGAKALYLRLGFVLYGTESRALRIDGRDYDEDHLAMVFR